MGYPKNCLFIDIGNEKIKIADINSGTKAAKIKQIALIDTPKDAIEDGILLDKDSLCNQIKVALVSEGFKNKNIVFIISSSKIITREIELPYMKKKILGK